MFKVYISDSVYDRIISVGEQRDTTRRSNLYKLLRQQPVQLLKSRYKKNSIQPRRQGNCISEYHPMESVYRKQPQWRVFRTS